MEGRNRCDYCAYAGIDTPEQLAAEAHDQFVEGCIDTQDEMEARGGPLPSFNYDNEDIPF
jgi:hypothetical protein